MKIGRHKLFPGFAMVRVGIDRDALDVASRINATRRARLERFVAAVLRRGGEVYEGAISRWRLGDPDSSVASFVPECRTAEHVAWHVCERCYGFGWSAQVCRRPAGT